MVGRETFVAAGFSSAWDEWARYTRAARSYRPEFKGHCALPPLRRRRLLREDHALGSCGLPATREEVRFLPRAHRNNQQGRPGYALRLLYMPLGASNVTSHRRFGPPWIICSRWISNPGSSPRSSRMVRLVLCTVRAPPRVMCFESFAVRPGREGCCRCA